LGDIGAHIIDTAEFITGQRLVGVSAVTETFVKERPLAASSSGLSAGGGTGRGPVTVDDAALFIGRLSGGGLASFEATRFATGHKNALRVEVNGSLGSLSFDFEAMNELWFHDHTIGSAEHGFRRVQ
ncbi:Gfo/Idh/MocA family oxidoreductase, partial [Microbispora sp. ZYX-F-249]